MTARATIRPQRFDKPAHWSNDPPAARAPDQDGSVDAAHNEQLSPTRYGDWVKNGIAVDFS